MGGINVQVQNSFEDLTYPNPAYVQGNLEVSPYMTVRFDRGLEKMDGARTLAYIRSRGSLDPLEGSDTARAHRQMIVLESLLRKLTSKEVLQNPTMLGNLYRFWQDKIETTLTDSDIVGLGIVLRDKPLSIVSRQIPVAGESAILVNPPVSKYGLWVWEPAGSNWSAFQEFIKTSL